MILASTVLIWTMSIKQVSTGHPFSVYNSVVGLWLLTKLRMMKHTDPPNVPRLRNQRWQSCAPNEANNLRSTHVKISYIPKMKGLMFPAIVSLECPLLVVMWSFNSCMIAPTPWAVWSSYELLPRCIQRCTKSMHKSHRMLRGIWIHVKVRSIVSMKKGNLE